MWHCGLPAGEVEALLSESEALVYGFRARAELGSRAHCNARRVAAHAATGGEVLWLHDDCGDVSLADGSVCAALSAVPGFGADGMQIFGWEDNERPKDVGAHAEAVSVRRARGARRRSLRAGFFCLLANLGRRLLPLQDAHAYTKPNPSCPPPAPRC